MDSSYLSAQCKVYDTCNIYDTCDILVRPFTGPYDH